MSTPKLLSSALLATLALAPVAAFAQATAALKSAAWWNPSESGWGLFTIDQGNVMATGWFTYDADGEPTWFLMPGVSAQPDGSYQGEVHRFTGVPLAQIVGAAADPSTSIGTATLRFDGDKTLRFDTSIGGQNSSKSLTRFAYGSKDLVCRAGPTSRAAATNYSDLWWNEASSGWGLFIQHVDNDLYATWYTYDGDREAVFLATAASRQQDGSYSGPLYRQKNGTPFTRINGTPPSSDADVIGNATLRFSDGQTGTFSYTIGSVTQSKSITRIQFGSSASVCEVQPYATTGGNSGQGEECHPAYRIGDTRQLRDSATTNGQSSSSTFRESIVREGTFNGQSGLVQEYDGVTSAGTGIYARSYLGNGNGTTASFGAESLNPVSGQILATSFNVPARVELQRSFQTGVTVPLDFKVNSTAQGLTVVTDIKTTYKLLGKERVSVPAGTFDACKFEVTVDESSSISGVVTRTQLAGNHWTSPVFGLLKRQTSGTSNVTVFGQSSSTTLSNTQELLSARMNGQSTP